MSNARHVFRGAMVGVIGGLVASWAMNEFMAVAGKDLQEALQTEEQNSEDQAQQKAAEGQPHEDATMKAADKIVSKATGGQHLSWRGKERGGPVVHYAFGSLIGGLYGAAAEIAPGITAGFGASFGTLLFIGADLLAVPAMGLSQNPAPEPASKLSSPFAAHLVYGVTTEAIRRILR